MPGNLFAEHYRQLVNKTSTPFGQTVGEVSSSVSNQLRLTQVPLPLSADLRTNLYVAYHFVFFSLHLVKKMKFFTALFLKVKVNLRNSA